MSNWNRPNGDARASVSLGSVVLIGNVVPAIGVRSEALAKLQSGDKINLSPLQQHGIEGGLYELREKVEAHHHCGPCVRLFVHRLGNSSGEFPTFTVDIV